jgi:hypothetical protein
MAITRSLIIGCRSCVLALFPIGTLAEAFRTTRGVGFKRCTNGTRRAAIRQAAIDSALRTNSDASVRGDLLHMGSCNVQVEAPLLRLDAQSYSRRDFPTQLRSTRQAPPALCSAAHSSLAPARVSAPTRT